MKHWNIGDKIGFTITYCADEFFGFDLNMGYSGLTGCFQIHFQLGGLSVALTFDIDSE